MACRMPLWVALLHEPWTGARSIVEAPGQRPRTAVALRSADCPNASLKADSHFESEKQRPSGVRPILAPGSPLSQPLTLRGSNGGRIQR